jgi:hypothetical protein
MAGAASKTARRSSPQLGKAATPEQLCAAAASSAMRRITPLNGGKHCRFANPVTGKNMHLSTSSDEFDTVVAELAPLGLGARLRSELDTLAQTYPASPWPATRDRLVASVPALS